MSDVVTGPAAPAEGGKLIVLTAPLTETIDHAGYFIQMSMASLPMWLEGILNRKYPKWRDVEYNDDGTARVHAGRRARARGVAAAPRSRPTTSSAAIRTISTSSSARTRASSPSPRTIRSA